MKKLIFLLSAAVVLISCNKSSYTISGIAKGFDNGKTVILQTQDSTGMTISLDTVKIENGKFEIKGKAIEPAFHALLIEGVQGPVPLIVENGDITVELNKDTIQKSKVSGTYNNDEYFKFNEEMKIVQEKLMDFQTQNMQAMNTAQQTKDTAVINKLMKGFSKLQEEVGVASKAKYTTYAETHPKSFISALIVQGMLSDPSADVKKTEALYNSLDEALKNTKPGKAVKAKLTAMKSPSVGATAPAVGDAK